jgi:uncharacterized protein (DUF433 family)
MASLERITVDSEILAGKPVVRGTRLAVEFILDLLDAGQTESEILDEYPGLTQEDIVAVRNYGGKDKAIQHVVGWLEDRLRGSLVILDHWDGDLSAVGIARPESPDNLVYISTWGRSPGRYFVELEAPPAPGSELPYEITGRYENVDQESLLGIVREHLGFGVEDR